MYSQIMLGISYLIGIFIFINIVIFWNILIIFNYIKYNNTNLYYFKSIYKNLIFCLCFKYTTMERIKKHSYISSVSINIFISIFYISSILYLFIVSNYIYQNIFNILNLLNCMLLITSLWIRPWSSGMILIDER